MRDDFIGDSHPGILQTSILRTMYTGIPAFLTVPLIESTLSHLLGLTPVCETGIKTPCKFKQPVTVN